MENPQMVSPWQSYCNNRPTTGCVFIGPFCASYCLDSTAEETISACKNAEKYAILMLIFKKIFWGQSPQTPILGRGYGAPSQTPPPSALRRFAPPRLLGTFGPSHHPCLNVFQKY